MLTLNAFGELFPLNSGNPIVCVESLRVSVMSGQEAGQANE